VDQPRVDRIEPFLARPEMDRAESCRGERRGQLARDAGRASDKDPVRRVRVRRHGRDARCAAQGRGDDLDAGGPAVMGLGAHLDHVLGARGLGRKVPD